MPPGFSGADFFYLLPEIVLTGGALLVLLLEIFLPRGWKGALPWVTLGVLAATGFALLPGAGQNLTIAKGLLAVDGFGFFFKVLFLLSASITVLMSVRYLEIERASAGEYYFLILCATLGMMFMAAGIDLITLFIGLETMAVSFYILVGYLRPSRRSNEAAVKYFVLGTFSLAILLYGMSLLYGLTGTTHLRGIATALLAAETGLLLPFAVIMLVAGLGFKIAAVPFHMWAPDVYEGAPTPITAFISVGSKAASLAMLLRIFVEGLPAFRLDGLGVAWGTPFGWAAFFYVLAIVTMTVGNLAALTQSNTKRMLAYSSIAHAGYLLIGIVAGTTRGVTAALLYLMVYALMQFGAFAVVVMLRRKEVIGDELKDLTGLYASHPGAAIAMLIFMLSLGGIPPTAGFIGKLWIFGAAMDAGYIWLAVIGVLNSALSLYYYVRVVVYMWISEPDPDTSRFTVSPALAAVLVVAAIGSIAFGVYPRMLFEFAEASAATLGVVPHLGLR
ncbi:NADH-quinone oxidoreductase subunit N [soil metagenome]